MKLKIKINGTTLGFTADIDSGQTSFEHFRTLVSTELKNRWPNLSEFPIVLSLNGKTPIDVGQNTTITETGIVTGDIIRVIIDTDLSKVLDEKQTLTKLPTQLPTAGTEHNITSSCSYDSGVMDTSDDTTELLSDNEGRFINRYMNGPMLCQETTENQLPCSLTREYIASDVVSATDALLVVIKVLMNEEGFKLKHDSLMKSDKKTVRLQYVYSNLNDTVCTLMCIPMGENLLVHGLHRNQLLLRSFRVKMFIKANPQTCSDPLLIYQKLPALSRRFKDSICFPLIQAFYTENGVECAKSLTSLPVEILLQILRLLDYRSLMLVSQLCAHFHKLADDNMLWKGLFFRDFKTTTDVKWQQLNDLTTEGFWKSAYKEAYLEKQKRRKQRIIFKMPFMWTFDQFIRQPWPIGGDYDRLPPLPRIERILGLDAPPSPFVFSNDNMNMY